MWKTFENRPVNDDAPYNSGHPIMRIIRKLSVGQFRGNILDFLPACLWLNEFVDMCVTNALI